jgi:hypothetical protein
MQSVTAMTQATPVVAIIAITYFSEVTNRSLTFPKTFSGTHPPSSPTSHPSQSIEPFVKAVRRSKVYVLIRWPIRFWSTVRQNGVPDEEHVLGKLGKDGQLDDHTSRESKIDEFIEESQSPELVEAERDGLDANDSPIRNLQ